MDTNFFKANSSEEISISIINKNKHLTIKSFRINIMELKCAQIRRDSSNTDVFPKTTSNNWNLLSFCSPIIITHTMSWWGLGGGWDLFPGEDLCHRDPRTSTTATSTHPTGMHSCCLNMLESFAKFF